MPPVQALNRQQLLALAVFVCILVGGCALLSLLVDHGLLHASTAWRPFDIHPSAFAIGLVGCVACLAAVAHVASRRRLKAMPLAVLAGCSLLGLGLCIVATLPGAGSVAIRDVISPADPAEQPAAFGFAVLFPNRSDRLDPAEAKFLQRQVAIFRECVTSKIIVRGFASSARFKIASDDQNFALANRRALTVERFLVASGYHVTVHIWNNFGEMRDARRAVDVGSTGERLLDDEARNRRVEILWHGSPCSGL